MRSLASINGSISELLLPGGACRPGDDPMWVDMGMGSPTPECPSELSGEWNVTMLTPGRAVKGEVEVRIGTGGTSAIFSGPLDGHCGGSEIAIVTDFSPGVQRRHMKIKGGRYAVTKCERPEEGGRVGKVFWANVDEQGFTRGNGQDQPKLFRHDFEWTRKTGT